MRTGIVATILTLGITGVWVASAWTDGGAAPKPSEAPVEWELNITYETPAAIEIKVPGTDIKKTYWYILYRVINRTGEEQQFAPDFTLYTNTGQMLRAGKKVPAAVYAAIKKLKNMPLLRDSTAMTGKLLQGADNAREGVAIWPDFDPKAGYFDIFIGGLSGEKTTVVLPVALKNTKKTAMPAKLPSTQPTLIGLRKKDIENQPDKIEKIQLEKTLQLRYTVPSEKKKRLVAPVMFISKKWVMR